MQLDKVTFNDISIFHQEEEYSIFHKLNFTRTVGGKEWLRRFFRSLIMTWGGLWARKASLKHCSDHIKSIRPDQDHQWVPSSWWINSWTITWTRYLKIQIHLIAACIKRPALTGLCHAEIFCQTFFGFSTGGWKTAGTFWKFPAFLPILVFTLIV